MPRSKRTRSRIVFQCRAAAKSVDRILDHLMAADVLAKGGTIDGHGKLLPVGVDINNPEREGHPVLNEWLPIIVNLCGGLRDSILKMSARL